MRMKLGAVVRHYLIGMCATLAGAWATELTGSMLPLAMGAAITLMCTATVVRKLWTRKHP